jgi:1,4-dihydroxy-2-naphthoate octaprenyltransferase
VTPAINLSAIRRLRARQELQLAAALKHADPRMATGWWSLLALRGLLPAAFSIATGVLVAAVQHHQNLGVALAVVGVLFILLQVLGPLHTALSANLGDRTAAWLYDELTGACVVFLALAIWKIRNWPLIFRWPGTSTGA